MDDSVEDGVLARRIAIASASASANERDAAAETMLCRRLYPRIRAYGLRHLRDEAASHDLAQHVVVVVLDALRTNRVEDLDRLAAFVMGVCRNTILEWKKGERRRSALLEKHAPMLSTTIESEPVATSVDLKRLTHCLAELTPREQTIMALTYYGEKEPAEIGRELSMSLGTVRVARHRALTRLHECITRGEAVS